MYLWIITPFRFFHVCEQICCDITVNSGFQKYIVVGYCKYSGYRFGFCSSTFLCFTTFGKGDEPFLKEKYSNCLIPLIVEKDSFKTMNKMNFTVDFKFINIIFLQCHWTTPYKCCHYHFKARQMVLCDFLLTFLLFVLYLPTNSALNESSSGHVRATLMSCS